MSFDDSFAVSNGHEMCLIQLISHEVVTAHTFHEIANISSPATKFESALHSVEKFEWKCLTFRLEVFKACSQLR